MFRNLKGSRTYLCALIVALVAGFHAMGYIGDQTTTLLDTIFGAGGLMALRAAVEK